MGSLIRKLLIDRIYPDAEQAAPSLGMPQ